MNCSACGNTNPEGARFCNECASSLAAACAACGSENPPGAKFCNGCAAPLGGGVAMAPPVGVERRPADYTPKHLADKILHSKSALEGERKQVTVMFADVKGSMELAEQLDPEQWHSILNRFFEILTEGVHRFEGTINQYTGDGIMALFGAPIAHEDHAQRACYAALYLRDEIALYATEVKREHGIGFLARMGINSGDVVVGRIGDDLRMDYTAQGHTVGLAQRMESLAEPSTCYVSDATAQLASGYFSLKDLGEFSVKGVSDSLRVHELVGFGELRTRLDVAHSRGLTQLVGRSDELQLLEAALARVGDGEAPIVGIVGEAGLGKSRLCFEFMESCRARGLTTFETTGVSHGKAIPYLPMLRLFRSFFDIDDQDSDVAARERVISCLPENDERLRAGLPLLFDFLGVPDPENPAPRMDPDARQRQLIDLAQRVLKARSQNETLVLLLEDLHWFDGASSAFFEPLVEALLGTRTFVLLNFRPEYQAPWFGKSFYYQLPIVPLGTQATGDLLAGLLGGDPSLVGLSQLIHAGTAGNPFFTEEVVQNLIESGKLQGTKGAYHLTTTVDTLEVPGTVQSLLASRIDRLSERDKTVLQTAAVIGREFDAQTLAAVVQLEVAQLRASLRALKDAEFIYEQSLYPVAEYLFKHPLTHEVALSSQLQQRRVRLHAQVAVVLEAAHGDDLDQQAALLAHHWENAGDRRQAAIWYERAAQWAGLRNVAEGMRHWERLRSLVMSLPQNDETLQLGIAASQGILGLGWRLLTPTVEATEVFEEGRAMAEKAGDLVSLAALHGTYACVLGLVDGMSDEYVRHSLEATRLADQTDNRGLQIAERAFLGFACVFAGRLERGLESYLEITGRFKADPALGMEFTGYSPLIGLMTSHAWFLARLGRIEEATEVREEAQRVAREHGDSEVLTWLQLSGIEIASMRADPAAAHECARIAREAGEESGTPQALFVGLITLGTAHRLQDDWDESVEVLEEAVKAVTGGSNRMVEGWVRSELSKSLLARGDFGRAKQEAQTAVTVARTQNSRCDEVRAIVALVNTQLQRADATGLAQVDQELARAQALLDETGARFYQPLVHECRARLAQLRGDQPAASRELEQARRLYDAMAAPLQLARLANDPAQ